MLQTLKTIPQKIHIETTLLTDWLKYDDANRSDYAIRVNEFKTALGLPLEHVRSYSPTERLIRVRTFMIRDKSISCLLT